MASEIKEDPSNEADVKEFVKKMFSPGYRFPQQDTDDCLKVEISDLVSFGDIKEASIEKPQNVEIGGTIMGFICTVRHFHPGKYKVTVIKPYNDKKEYNTNDPLVIFHHEKVDPNLLVLEVIRLCKDYCAFHRNLRNSINRYDWCEWTHYGGKFAEDESDEDEFAEDEFSEDEFAEDEFAEDLGGTLKSKSKYSKATDCILSLLNKDFEEDVQETVPLSKPDPSDFGTLIYFTKTEKAKQLDACILKNQIHRSSVIKNLFSVQDDEGDTISIGVNFTPFNSIEWEFAKAFQDSDTGSYFALVLNGYLSLEEGPWKELYTDEEKKDLGFSTVRKTGLEYPMRHFMLKDC